VLRETVFDEEGNVEKTITYLIGYQRISQIVTDKDSNQQEYYFTYDAHGSTRVLLDIISVIAQIYSFDAYGNALGFDPVESLTEFLYSGEQFDSKIGQQYLRQRYYDPNTGRFNRLDPFYGNSLDPQSFHKYLYTHADPVNGIDPTGEVLVGMVSGLLIRMSVYAKRIDNATTVAVRLYREIVTMSVLANYLQGVIDSVDNLIFGVQLMRATSYNFKLLKKFRKIPTTTLKATVISQILRIGRIVTEIVGNNITASGQFGVRVKPTGFIDFSNHLHPNPKSTIFMKLTGSRSGDRSKLFRLTKIKPGTYIWHHHEIVGIMQLVDGEVHKHTGGFVHTGGAMYYNILTNGNGYR
jgi:RHS repeat-associated protein